MVQIQLVIEFIERPDEARPLMRITANKLVREDANKEEREIAKHIEQLHAGIMEMIAKQEDGTFEEIKKPRRAKKVKL